MIPLSNQFGAVPPNIHPNCAVKWVKHVRFVNSPPTVLPVQKGGEHSEARVLGGTKKALDWTIFENGVECENVFVEEVTPIAPRKRKLSLQSTLSDDDANHLKFFSPAPTKKHKLADVKNSLELSGPTKKSKLAAPTKKRKLADIHVELPAPKKPGGESMSMQQTGHERKAFANVMRLKYHMQCLLTPGEEIPITLLDALYCISTELSKYYQQCWSTHFVYRNLLRLTSPAKLVTVVEEPNAFPC